jgi:hypothetical protein
MTEQTSWITSYTPEEWVLKKPLCDKIAALLQTPLILKDGDDGVSMKVGVPYTPINQSRFISLLAQASCCEKCGDMPYYK